MKEFKNGVLRDLMYFVSLAIKEKEKKNGWLWSSESVIISNWGMFVLNGFASGQPAQTDPYPFPYLPPLILLGRQQNSHCLSLYLWLGLMKLKRRGQLSTMLQLLR